MKKFLMDNAVPIFTGLITALGVLLIAIVWLYNLAQIRLPEIDKKLTDLTNGQTESLSKTQQELDSKLSQTKEHQEKRILLLEKGVSALKVSLLDLRIALGKDPTQEQLKELIAAADLIGQSKSEYFIEARLSDNNAVLPKVNPLSGWAGVSKELGLETTQEEAVRGINNPQNIQQLLSRSVLSESAHWERVNDKLKVNYKNGSIIYTPAKDLGKEELDTLAIEFNEISSTVKRSWLHPQIIQK